MNKLEEQDAIRKSSNIALFLETYPAMKPYQIADPKKQRVI